MFLLQGTETATVWIGYMDGAVQAGERAAHEVLEFLHYSVSPSFASSSAFIRVPEVLPEPPSKGKNIHTR